MACHSAEPPPGFRPCQRAYLERRGRGGDERQSLSFRGGDDGRCEESVFTAHPGFKLPMTTRSLLCGPGLIEAEPRFRRGSASLGGRHDV